ncbi:MAG: metallophosphoesterase [Muribaculaceae bacterium]
MKRFLLNFIFVVSLLSVHTAVAQSVIPEGDVNFIIANDLGRNGYYLQKPMAEMMGELADSVDISAVLALGDVHHFDGVQSVSDPLWWSNYESIYTHPALMLSWLPVLGNHEYRGNTDAVLEYSNVSRRWQMPARYYSQVFVGEDSDVKVKVIFIDTTPLIDKYRKTTEVYPDAAQQEPEAQLQWLEGELSDRSGADWVVVVGHHPIYADTPKDDCERLDMQRKVDTLLRRYSADMYICGHIHNFQHIRVAGSDTDYIVNSAASLSRKKVKPIEGTVFCGGDEGFSVLSATKDTLILSMINFKGEVVHSVRRVSK